MVCKATDKLVVMHYEGEKYGDPNSGNGHPYWICLHNNDEAQDQLDVDAFNTDHHC